jgi:hypothetical protein
MANVAAKFTISQNVIFAPKFKSASEVTEYTKRMANAAYYTNNTADQKRAYSSTYTTFLGASVYAIPNVMRTSVPNTTGFDQRPEKFAPGRNVWNPT